jgi:hypothetical protein
MIGGEDLEAEADAVAVIRAVRDGDAEAIGVILDWSDNRHLVELVARIAGRLLAQCARCRSHQVAAAACGCDDCADVFLRQWQACLRRDWERN